MWFPTDHRPPSTQVTPRRERRLPKLDRSDRPGGTSGWSSDISKPSKTSKGSKDKVKTGNNAMSGKNDAAVPTVSKPPTGNGNLPTTGKPFFVEDEQKSKITVISLKSNRTSRTVQTTQSSLTPRVPEEPEAPPATCCQGILDKLKSGFRYDRRCVENLN